MKKILFILTALSLILSDQFASASYLYTFSSGDILDPDATDAYYGLGRIDFDANGIPYPTVIESGDPRSLGAGLFTRHGKEYIYVTKTLKYGASTTHLVTDGEADHASYGHRTMNSRLSCLRLTATADSISSTLTW